MNGNAKKFLSQNAVTIIYIAVMAGLFLLMSAMPRMGEEALRYSIIKGVIVMVLSVCLVAYHVIRKVIQHNKDTKSIKAERHEQDNSATAEFERAFDSNRVSITFGIVIAVILVIFSLVGISSDMEDLKNGTVSVTLTNTQIQARTNTGHNNASRLARRPYYLKGRDGSKIVSFTVYGDVMREDVRNIIRESSPDITVVYYPKTKTLSQIQIHLDGRTIVLPDGTPIVHDVTQTSSQNEPAETEIIYVEVPISEVEIGDLTIGTDLSDAMKILSDNSWRMPIPPLGDPDRYENAEDEIRTALGLERVTCILMMSGDTQLFILSDIDSGAIVELYARKPQT
ncbi:MAG: hypothetical protein IJZ47_05515 [Oscillospiraceae bacterium]|nr:hypothetical protein [Oscillospiraceae bacterium]